MNRWDGVVKTLHWTLAFLILVEVPAGFVMTWTYGPSFKDAHVLDLHILASQIHHTTGLIVLAGALVWLTRRAMRPRPPWDASLPAAQRVAATVVHVGLLLLLVVVPWSGWTALSSLEDSAAYGPTHIWFFGTDGLVPRIWTPLPFSDPTGYRRFGGLHIWTLWAGLALVAMHVASALWHHFASKDRVLRRMWPLGDG